MTPKALHDFCLSLPSATSDFPFDEVTQAFRIKGKMFALVHDRFKIGISVNLKCDPDLAADLRTTYSEVKPGWHMNHHHWNTVQIDGNLPDEKLIWMIRHSYECVLKRNS